MTEELSIADVQTDAGAERSLGDVQQDAATFDMGAWAEGVRPVRRAVRVFLANDDDALNVAVELEKLADRIDRLPDGPEVDALIDEAVALQEIGRGQWVVVEAHSQERRQADEKRIIEDLGLDTKSEDTKVRDGSVLMAHMAAEQVVEPKMSGDDMLALAAARWPEAYKIIQLCSDVNTEAMGDAAVLRVDFTRRRSGRR